MPTLTATERPAQFVHDIDLTKLPSAVREQATRCLLDALGVALAGMSEPSAQAAALADAHRARVKLAVRDLERLPRLADLMDALVTEDSASRGPASPKG